MKERRIKQNKEKPQDQWMQWIGLYILFIIFVYLLSVGGKYIQTKVFASQPVEKTIVSPIPSSSPTPTVTPTPTLTEADQIVTYIKDVFGKDAHKAFRLLECENKSLNPNATSSTKDYGIFQINENWQKVQPKFLKNWKINIQIAKQLFDENGGKFNLWTCGKTLGI